MEVKAVAKTVRVTSRKARLVLDEIRGLDVDRRRVVPARPDRAGIFLEKQFGLVARVYHSVFQPLFSLYTPAPLPCDLAFGLSAATDCCI